MGFQTRINNADFGATAIAQDIYDQSTTQKHRLGERLVLGDRVFRYCSAGAALIAGQLCESAAFGGALTTIQTNLTVATAGSVGTRTVVVTTVTDAVAVNLYADGYLTTYDGSAAQGVGQSYRIKSHPVLAAAGNLTLTLYDDIVVEISTSAKVNLISNPYKAVKVSAASAPVGYPVGIPLVVIASGSYGWVQTWGPACGLADGNWTLNLALVRSAHVAGAIDIQVAGASSIAVPPIGYSMSVIADTKYGSLWLQLAS